MQVRNPTPDDIELIVVGKDDEWRQVQRQYSVGCILIGKVVWQAPFGVFLQFPHMPFKGLIRIVDFKDEERMTADEFPQMDSEVAAVILGFDEKLKQIVLGIRPRQLATAVAPANPSRS